MKMEVKFREFIKKPMKNVDLFIPNKNLILHGVFRKCGKVIGYNKS